MSESTQAVEDEGASGTDGTTTADNKFIAIFAINVCEVLATTLASQVPTSRLVVLVVAFFLFYRKISFNTPIKEKRIKPETIDADTLDNERELFLSLIHI